MTRTVRTAALLIATALLVACADCERCACEEAGATDGGGAPPDAAPDAVPDTARDGADAQRDGAPLDGAPRDGHDGDGRADAGAVVPVIPAPGSRCWIDGFRAGLCSTCNGGADCEPGLLCRDDDEDPETPRVCTRDCRTDTECGPGALCRRPTDAAAGTCDCGGCGELAVSPGVSCVGSGAGTAWRHPANGAWYDVYEIPDEFATATWGSNPIAPLCWSGWVWTASPPDGAAWWTMPDATWCRRFRRRVDIPEGARACVEVSADDRVQIHLEGRVVAQHVAAPEGGPANVTGVTFLPAAGGTTELEFCVCSTAPSYGGLLFNVHYK